MNFLRRALETRGGKAAAIVLALVFLAAGFHAVAGYFSTPESSTMCICTETGKTFRHVNKIGESYPVYSSYSGKNTGVMAEPCYWTADGQTKKDPTWVLLNSLAGKPGPTFCPDCGRLVVSHNPPPVPGATPPPTQDMYQAPPAEGGSE